MSTLKSETPCGMVFDVQYKGRHSDLHIDVFMVLQKVHIVKIRPGKGDASAYLKFMANVETRISQEIGIRDQVPSLPSPAIATMNNI